jgi:predicted MPP superfamily phosphohydrolase
VALLAPVAFYAAEARMVFLFPAAIDGSRQPFAEAWSLTGRAGGTVAVMRVVIVLACVMVLGGLAGRGFVRSWCLGCLAVCVWYEMVLARDAARSTGRLELANAGRLRVREESVGPLGLPRPVRLLYASDLHLGHWWTRGVAGEIVELAARVRPDAILLGGDLADSGRGVGPLGTLVRQLSGVCPVYAVPGNHDRRAGMARVRECARSAGAVWLDERIAQIGSIELHGNVVARGSHRRARVLVAHDPRVFARAADAEFDLVLAGHLHGGQCVLVTVGGRHYPGALLSRWTGPRFACDGERRATLLVSAGAADTLPVRWNCPREVLLCTLS